MRSSIDAQSCASVPPAPAWISIKQWFGSIGLENIRRNSSVSRVFPPPADHPARPEWCRRLLRSCPSRTVRGCRPGFVGQRSITSTTSSSAFFSRPRSWARFGVIPRYPGLRSGVETSSRRSFCQGSQRYLRISSLRAARSVSLASIWLRISVSIMGVRPVVQRKIKSSRQVYSSPALGWSRLSVCWPGKNHPSGRRLAMSGEFYIYKE